MSLRKAVKASIFEHLRATYGGTVNWESPSRMDPDTQSVESWACIFIDTQKGSPSRGANEFGELTVRLEINSRKQDQLYETEDLCDALEAVFDRTESIEVKDYEDSDEPVIGYVRLHEPEIRDATKEGDVWRKAIVTIQGTYQES